MAAAFAIFKLLPVDAASAAGGWIGRTIGSMLPLHRAARRRLQRALPELSGAEADNAMSDMWDNLGRVFAEYPHIHAITDNPGADDPGNSRVEVAGLDHMAGLRELSGAVILFSGHFANWEVFALTMTKLGLPYAQIYRAPNNPHIERIMHRMRRLDMADIAPKGPAGARKAIEVLHAGRRLGLLVDQKMNDGIPAPFFGRDAMTAPAVAQLALRFDCPIVPVRLERLEGCRFRITCHAPMRLDTGKDREAEVAAAMADINRMLEDWIRARPGQWLWLHRRWPED